MKGLSVVLILVLVGEILLGLALAKTDVLNPRTSEAMAERMRLETQMLADQYQFDKELRALQMEEARRKREIDLEMYKKQKELELELQKQRALRESDVRATLVLLGGGVALAAVFALAVSMAYYIFTLAKVTRAGLPTATPGPVPVPITFPPQAQQTHERVGEQVIRWSEHVAP